jgi:hypothetical protein
MDKPWFNHEVKLAIHNRNRLYKRYKRTRNPTHATDWKHAAREANFHMSMAKKAHSDQIKSFLMTMDTGDKKYWKLAKKVYGSKKIMSIPSLMVGDKSISTSHEKAIEFSNFFAAQQTLEANILNHPLPPLHFLTDQRLSSISTTPAEVHKILKSLDTGKANGADGVSNRLLKECSSSIATPLSNLLNKSFALAKVPSSWKESNICPIHKKDDKAIVSNYRPIAVLS